jgi:hypothetical protein
MDHLGPVTLPPRLTTKYGPNSDASWKVWSCQPKTKQRSTNITAVLWIPHLYYCIYLGLFHCVSFQYEKLQCFGNGFYFSSMTEDIKRFLLCWGPLQSCSDSLLRWEEAESKFLWNVWFLSTKLLSFNEEKVRHMAGSTCEPWSFYFIVMDILIFSVPTAVARHTWKLCCFQFALCDMRGSE